MKAKFVYEGIADILKPKDPEIIKKFQNYMLDVLSNMKEHSKDNEHFSWMISVWGANRKLMEKNFLENILPKETADTILKKLNFR